MYSRAVCALCYVVETYQGQGRRGRRPGRRVGRPGRRGYDDTVVGLAMLSYSSKREVASGCPRGRQNQLHDAKANICIFNQPLFTRGIKSPVKQKNNKNVCNVFNCKFTFVCFAFCLFVFYFATEIGKLTEINTFYRSTFFF